jgi:hypothetical protein
MTTIWQDKLMKIRLQKEINKDAQNDHIFNEPYPESNLPELLLQEAEK